MVPTKNVSPTGDTEEPQNTKKTDAPSRPVTQTARDDSKGQKFKEVLSTLEEKTKSSKVVIQTDSGEEPVSPMSLVTDTVGKKVKATTDDAQELVAITDTSDVAETTKTVPETVIKERPVTIIAPKTTTDKPTLAATVTPAVLPSVTPTVTPSTASPIATPVTPTVIPTIVPTIIPPIITPLITKPVVTSTDSKSTEVSDSEEEEVVVPVEGKTKKAGDTDQLQKPKDDAAASQVNPGVQPTSLAEVPIATALDKVPDQAVKAREVLNRLALEMISRLDVITTTDRTDTSIKLQHPPLFAGAEFVITEYKTAQNQFNVTFTGLSPEAHHLIAMKQNQEELRTALLEKGYNLQMVTIEQKIPGLESTKTESTFSQLGGRENANTQGDATEEER